MIAKSERLTVLSDAEQEALYGLPDFDDAQRLEYLALSESEFCAGFLVSRSFEYIAARRTEGTHHFGTDESVSRYPGRVLDPTLDYASLG